MLFFLPKNVPVLPGKYEWTNVNFNAEVRTFNGRLLTLQADVTCCSFYDGSAVAHESDADLPAQHLFRDHRDA